MLRIQRRRPRVCRSENLRRIQGRRPDSAAGLLTHFPGIFCVHRPCPSRYGRACCAGRLNAASSTRLLQLDCSTGLEREASCDWSVTQRGGCVSGLLIGPHGAGRSYCRFKRTGHFNGFYDGFSKKAKIKMFV